MPELAKCAGRELHVVEAVAMSLAAPLGLGVFVLTGCVAQSVAGPSVVLSVVIATLVALLAGLSYAELAEGGPGTTAPTTLALTSRGLGRLLGFLVAWNLALDLIIGSTVAARGARAALESLLNTSLTLNLSSTPAAGVYMSGGAEAGAFSLEQVDFVALALALLAAGGSLVKTRQLVAPRAAVTLLVVLAALLVFVAGLTQADGANWRSETTRGFLPLGFMGTLRGAAILIFAFGGIELVVAPGRRVQSRHPALRGVLIVVFSTFLALLGVGLALTLAEPYFLLDPDAAVVWLFEGWPRWVVGVIGVISLCASLLASLGAAVRLLVTLLLEQDDRGCGARSLTLGVGLAVGLVGTFLPERQLVQVLSQGSLLAMTAVPAALVLLRCGPVEDVTKERGGAWLVLRRLVNLRAKRDPKRQPSASSAMAAIIALLLICVSGAGVAGLAVHGTAAVREGAAWAVVLLSVLTCLCLLSILALAAQPHSQPAGFKTPLFPLGPSVASLAALCLLVAACQTPQWIRLVGWSLLGVVVHVARRCRGMDRTPNSSTAEHTVAVELSGSEPPRTSLDFSLHVEQRSASCSVASVRSTTSLELHIKVEDSPPPEEKAPPPSWLGDVDKIEPVPNPQPPKETVLPLSSSLDVDQIQSEPTPQPPEEREWSQLETQEEEGCPREIIAEVHEGCEPPVAAAEHRDPVTPRSMSLAGASAGETSDEDALSQFSIKLGLEPEILHNPPPPPSPLAPLQEPVKLRSPPAPKPLSPVELPLESAPQVVELRSPPSPPEPAPKPDELKSPAAPPLPPAEVVKASEKKKPQQSEKVIGLQEELKTTLKLRNQRQINEIENTVVKVDEGIQIFGGRSRPASQMSKDGDGSIQRATRAGKFDDPTFVHKLDLILRGQQSGPKRNAQSLPAPPRAPVRSRPVVVLNVGDEPRVSQGDELTRRMHEMRGTLEMLLDPTRRESLRPPEAARDTQRTRKSAPVVVPARQPAVHRSLENFSADIQIVALPDL